MYVTMMPAKFGIDKTVALEFSAACAWELELEMEARGVEPRFRQSARESWIVLFRPAMLAVVVYTLARRFIGD